MRSLLRASSSSQSSTSSASSSSKKSSRSASGGGGDADGDAKSSGRIQLYLNVYDLTPINKYLYWLGLGVFHSGIEVHGMEYAFGAHDFPSSGVFEVEPKSCPGFIFRRSVSMGTTDMSRTEFLQFLEQLSVKYHGDSYHLIAKNCNHFTSDVCLRLTGRRIPGWVNRLARLGSFCNCFLPEGMQVTAVTHLPDHVTLSDGSESFVSRSSIAESDDENTDHLLLWSTPRTDLSSPEKTSRVAREHQ